MVRSIIAVIKLSLFVMKTNFRRFQKNYWLCEENVLLLKSL